MKRRLDMNTNTNNLQCMGHSTPLNEQMQGKINNRILAFHEKLTNLVMDQVENQLQKVAESLNIPHARQDTHDHHESRVNNPNYESNHENSRAAMNIATTVNQSVPTNPEVIQNPVKNIHNNGVAQVYRMNHPPRMESTNNYPGCNVLTSGYNVNGGHRGQFIGPDATNNNDIDIGKDNNNLLLISIYLPSTGSRDHYEEFIDTIDQLNEIVLKYQDTHFMIIGGDLNEDLGNTDRINKRKDYLEKFVKETGLKYDNEGKTFVKVNGEECSELDYFLHKLGKIKPTHKQVMNSIMNNTSDHHPIKMKILYGISNDADCKNLTKDCTNRAVKWDKVDIDLYVAMTNEHSDSILSMPLDTLEQATSVLEQVHGFLNDAAVTCASNKPRYKAKPKLNVWSPNIKLALDEMRKFYA
ncbi:unnamed protein product [Mytilus coruscus]|uniref:Endonuclease/exonuclease/phosphatase domain-containing protein n=1 Tax=Mytilus coruscus TaxID=42192 RepID=A0A6J8CV61_MYTCO|nr:unnamed protein product [Mytilus coruscus]